MAFILNSNSKITCPHGGMVSHSPTSFSTYMVDGSPPMRLVDTYMITGCHNVSPLGNMMVPSPCIRVQWTSPSRWLLVKGSPTLTNSSVGMCYSAAGIPHGPAVIGSFQMKVQEPNMLTLIDF